MADSGIYQIRNLRNGKFYIGSACNLKQRRIDHFKLLRGNRHHSRYLQASWNKYGQQAFIFEVIELVAEKEQLVPREQHYFDTLNPAYNICRVAGSCLGVRHSEEAKAKMSRAHKGKKLSPEHVAKISARMRGSKWTDAQRAKMAVALKRRSEDPAYLEKLRENARKLASDPEHGRKISAALKGRPSPLKGKERSPEAVAKTAAAHRGMKRSDETRKKLSEKAKGRPFVRHNDDYRRKLSEASKGKQKSPEHMAALQAGRAARVYTDEQRTAISEALKRSYEDGTRSRERSAEYRAKIADGLRGKKLSPEHRAAVSAAMTGRKRGPYNLSDEERSRRSERAKQTAAARSAARWGKTPTE